MLGLHVLSSRGGQVKLGDFELLTMVLSALKWREKNGDIKLYTDSIGKHYLLEHGLQDVWNEIDTALDGFHDLGIDENVFWAGAKLYALSLVDAPCVIVDLDFILWQYIDFTAYEKDIAVIHLEDIHDGVYPPKSRFRFFGGWEMPSWLDWNVLPANAALVYHGSWRLLKEYTDFALDFMQYAEEHEDRLHYMVFAEQRWLSMCAKHFGVAIHELSSLEKLFGKQKYFTHLWGHKQKLRREPEMADKFCRDATGRIKRDFPDFASNLKGSFWAARYFA